MGVKAACTGIAPGKVDQLAADLRRGQPEEIGSRRRPDLAQSATEPDDSVLQYVVGLLPAMNTGEVAEHDSRQPGQPFRSKFQELVKRRRIT